jgi:hemoglobin/transferrin/lactoferrin receptor protein
MYQNKITDNILLQAGTRYNQFCLNAEFDTAFYPFPFTEAKINKGNVTGNLGLVFNPSEKWTFGADISTAFRSPNVDDMGKVFDSEPGSVVVPNPDLNAEYAYNAEIGITKIFNDIVKWGITGYYTVLNNAMVRRDFTLNGQDSILYDGEMSKVQAIQNAAMATVYGIESNIEIKLKSGFGFATYFNYQKGEEELDDGTTSPLRHAAPWFGTTHFTYSKQKTKIDLYAVYNGEVSYEDMPEEERGKDYMYADDKDGNPYSPAWYTLNLKMLYKINERISVSGGIENITDQCYKPYSSGIAAPGRNYIISLKGSF